MDEPFHEVHTAKVQKCVLTTPNGKKYTMLVFVCPGCQEFGGSGIHMLPVNTSVKKPSWKWDGNLDLPTLKPSIMTSRGTAEQCHSFLENGVFRFLNDSKHSMKKTRVEMPDLPDWYLES